MPRKHKVVVAERHTQRRSRIAMGLSLVFDVIAIFRISHQHSRFDIRPVCSLGIRIPLFSQNSPISFRDGRDVTSKIGTFKAEPTSGRVTHDRPELSHPVFSRTITQEYGFSTQQHKSLQGKARTLFSLRACLLNHLAGSKRPPSRNSHRSRSCLFLASTH
jgi:hypothetical protein